MGQIDKLTKLLADHELVFLGAAAPFLLFPNRWTWVAFGVIAGTWLMRWVVRGAPSVLTPLDIPIFLLLAATGVGLGTSLDMVISAPKAWGIVLGISLYYGLVNALRTRPAVGRMAVLLLLVTLGVAVISLVGTDWDADAINPINPSLTELAMKIPRLIHGLPTGGIIVPSASGLFHPREVGGALGMLVPVALALIFLGEGRVRWLALGTALITGLPLILSQASSAFGGVAAAVVLFIAYRRPWLLLPIVGVITLVGILVLATPLRELALTVLEPSTRLGDSVAGRIWTYRSALYMLGDMPWTGVGLNMFGLTIWDMYPDARQWTLFHAHNLLLQNALDVGIPGLEAFMVLIITFCYTAFRALRQNLERNERALLLGLLGAVLSYLVYGVLDTFTLGSKPGAAFWVLLGIGMALARLTDDTNPVNRPFLTMKAQWGMPAILLGLLAAGTVLVTFTFSDLVGTFQLNKGTVQAHQALVELRNGQSVPSQRLESTIRLLDEAEQRGNFSTHTLLLQGSLRGWMGDFPGAVSYLELAVAKNGDIPPDLPWISDFYKRAYDYRWSERSLNIVSAASWHGDPGIYLGHLTLYKEQNLWEPYVQAAIILDRYKQDRDKAVQVLETGLGKVTQPGPLEYYLQQLKLLPR